MEVLVWQAPRPIAILPRAAGRGVEGLRADARVRGRGVFVNAIGPGPMDTPFLRAGERTGTGLP